MSCPRVLLLRVVDSNPACTALYTELRMVVAAPITGPRDSAGKKDGTKEVQSSDPGQFATSRNVQGTYPVPL